MHELSIAIAIVEAAAETASSQEGEPVAVHLDVGVLSGVVKEALISAWEFARADSRLENAELILREVAATAHCPCCQCEQKIESIQCFRCDVCGSPVRQVIHGRELEIVALEMSE